MYSQPRSASVVATTDGVLWTLDRCAFMSRRVGEGVFCCMAITMTLQNFRPLCFQGRVSKDSNEGFVRSAGGHATINSGIDIDIAKGTTIFVLPLLVCCPLFAVCAASMSMCMCISHMLCMLFLGVFVFACSCLVLV